MNGKQKILISDLIKTYQYEKYRVSKKINGMKWFLWQIESNSKEEKEENPQEEEKQP
jgi:hypothetical protein